MNDRLTSAIASILINGVVGYLLFVGLAISIQRQAPDRMTVVDLQPDRVPVLPRLPPRPSPLPDEVPETAGVDWAIKSPEDLRNLAFMTIQKWINENTFSEEERRLARWRVTLPQGSGPGRVTRLRPPNLTTHTLYWPAAWKGPLPIIVWGNGFQGRCTNSSLPYAAFLSEIASYGYFIVAVGNDDIDYPQPEGLQILADGRHLHTQASALTRAVDWAITENSRAGSPYAGKLDTGRIAYMGHGCGGQLAMTASSSDRRATTIVELNASARFYPASSDPGRKASLAHFEGRHDDDRVLDVGDANFARADTAAVPMYKAALGGMGPNGAYPGPDRRWSKAVIAWLDWQLKGDGNAATLLSGLGRNGWSRIDATGLEIAITDGKGTRKPIVEEPPLALILPTAAAAARVADAQAFAEVPRSQVQVIPEDGVYVLRNLVDDNPLYTFDKDEPGKSNCAGACADTWRPFLARQDAQPIGKWTLVKRDDGATQWAYEGKPVYSFSAIPEPVATRNGTGRWHPLPTFPIQ